MIIYHIHHIIPKHMGGTDDPSNLIKLTIQEHAEAHKILYDKYGKWQDEIAWKALSGQISNSKAIKLSQKLRDTSYMQSESYKNKISIANKGKIPHNKNKTGHKHSEETKNKISTSLISNKRRSGIKHNKQTISTLTEKSSKLWEIKFPNGELKIIKNLKLFCTQHKITYTYFIMNKKYKGFSCIKLE